MFFSDFAVIFNDYVMKLTQGCNGIYLVFDRYFQESLKKCARSQRGSRSMLAFEGDDTLIPNNMEQTYGLKQKQERTQRIHY